MSIRAEAEKTVKKYWVAKIPKPVEKALGAALRSLYIGPSGPDMGFEKAVSILRDWWSDVASDVWYDIQYGEVFDQEPRAFEEDGELFEPAWESYIFFDARASRNLVFGRELAQHI